MYVTVRATDNGRPQLDDVCTFKITIEDINDNPPIFDKVKYEQSIPADFPVNKVVMPITSYDFDDGENSIIKYELLPEKDYQYFRIDENNGLIYLARPIDRRPGQYYNLVVRASNIVPDHPQDAQTDVRIKIIESHKKPPIFLDVPSAPIRLQENFTDYSQSLVTLRAMSNVPDKAGVIFELVNGRTEQTNSKKTFVFNQSDDTASISLGKSLDFEEITEYTLTMIVRNTWDSSAEVIVKIKVEDVNDNIPYFTEVTSGSILENEPPGTPVMQVRAFDSDGTQPNNVVTFELADNTEYFAIDPVTGNITALTTFDREERDYYNVKVIATDSAPSSLYQTGQPNKGQQVFRIEIADKNDHPPHFESSEYTVSNLGEDVNQNFKVVEVKAVDDDAASQIFYTIVDGNIGNAFKIDSVTGVIAVNAKLDYENITDYSLRVRAYDGIYNDYATVKISIENINDNPPVFTQDKYSTTIKEEEIVDGCIMNIEAYDPDIKDRMAPQYIKYHIVKEEQQPLLSIDTTGCLRTLKPLDRDMPNGHKQWQIVIAAVDEDGKGLRKAMEAIITLDDINDNPPFLTNHMPVVWNENQQPGNIVQLTANDYDEPKNGAPFSYAIDTNASEDIRNKFNVAGDNLVALAVYDREEQKEYFIPIMITDSGYPRMRNVSILHLIIGDENDNPMKEGKSNIFVYNYKGEAPDTEIGRIYVEDPDDWDLPDKEFDWKNGVPDQYFELRDGMITLRQGTPAGHYDLFFTVTEESFIVPRHQVDAQVTVTVKDIPEEAVDKSGSVRFYGITAEEFIRTHIDANGNEVSLKERFRHSLARILNATLDNVDVFTVLKNENSSVLDVRFSAHGSPYYEAELLNGKVLIHQHQLEKELNVKMLMVNIDECLIERNKCQAACTNVLHKSNVPLLVYTNTTSFVGVNAFIQAECACDAPARTVCLNGGTPLSDTCECMDGFEGPHCEIISIGFSGAGYALYPSINPCDSMKITLEVIPNLEHGLIMYIGPMNYNHLMPVSDFLSLELIGGYPVLKVDYGTGTSRVDHKHIKFEAGKPHQIEIVLQRTSIEMTVDNCKMSSCLTLGAPQGPNEFLNVNAPLQLGGTATDLRNLGQHLNWSHIPMTKGYHGCIKNLTVDGRTYNIGTPSLSKNVDPGCHRSVAVAVSFGINTNFLIAILVCLAILLVLFLAVVVHKRHHDGWLAEKDMDDIRETIINYEDEGGGERDTDYDLNVLRSPPIYEDKSFVKDHMLRQEALEVPDIGGFLVDKKDTCDKDTDAHPLDDVRHYAYEGDGNSSRSSLSSLASCTDDGDLRFDYLSNFGPRFRKLADMYGEEPSDVDSNVDDEDWRI